VVEDWAIFRDAGQFDRLLALWHEDGRMMTTWAQVSAAAFVERSREAFARGAQVHHLLSGCHIDINGDRAVAQTKMSILQRGMVDGVLCDAKCDGRFYDFFERRNGAWKIVLRQPTYERDRLDPVDPAITLDLDKTLLEQFPEGYRHLAYLQTRLGMQVKTDMPGIRGGDRSALCQRTPLAGDATADRDGARKGIGKGRNGVMAKQRLLCAWSGAMSAAMLAVSTPALAQAPAPGHVSWYGDPKAPDISGVWVRVDEAAATGRSHEGWTPFRLR
jgi:hypothetical protein